MWPFKKSSPKTEPPTAPSQPSRELRALSFVPPEVIQQIGGLPRVAIYGFMEGEGFSAEHFRPNPPFLKFLHEVIKCHVCANPSAQSAARQQQSGSLSIIDLRTPEGPQGNVPLEDIIGIFEVKDGEIRPELYYPNEKYLVFSAHGPPILSPDLQKAFLSEILKLPRENA